MSLYSRERGRTIRIPNVNGIPIYNRNLVNCNHHMIRPQNGVDPSGVALLRLLCIDQEELRGVALGIDDTGQ